MSAALKVQTVAAENSSTVVTGSNVGLRYSANNTLATTYVPSLVHEVLRSSGRRLESNTREFMESRFNEDFSQVRVHTDVRAARSARTVNARAYTVGNNVVFGSQQFQPETTIGRYLLAHELTHVIQQSSATKMVGNEPHIIAENISEQEANWAAQVVSDGREFHVEENNMGLSIQRQVRTRSSQRNPEIRFQIISRNHIQIVVGGIRIGTLEITGRESAREAVRTQGEISNALDLNGEVISTNVMLFITYSPNVGARFFPRNGSWERVNELLEERGISDFEFSLAFPKQSSS